ncbi:thiamine pyrophosphate-binding protein [Actinomyces wuliandei]|uniref:thiamine pyrophosphate-binding protein n=1 Tax=Actinomyces wuliandei TaxID=2057743 RepID=UPI001FAB1F65|nr:thiamine pyrophosphate-binding protein [Actinomyces wuliandei]
MTLSTPPGTQPPSLVLARAVVAALLAEGVREAVLCPGSRNAPLAWALADAAEAGRVQLRVVLDERSAGFMALGMARAHALEGRLLPAAVVTTSGTAVPNLHPAACEADAAGVPLLLVCADRPHELVGTGANQTMQQTSVFADAVRAVVDLPADLTADLGAREGTAAVAGQVRSAVAAATGALSRDPGPVLVNTRFRPPLAPLVPPAQQEPGEPSAPGQGVETANRPATSPRPAPGHPGDAAVRPMTGTVTDLRAAVPGLPDLRLPGPADLADRGAPASTRGLVVAGDTPHPGTGRTARSLAEALGWPLLAEPTSQARGGPSALTRYAELLGTQAGQELASRAEHVVVAGHPSLSRPVSALLGRHDLAVTVLAERARWTDVAGTASEIVHIDPTTLSRSPGLPHDPSLALLVARACGLGAAPPGWLRSWHDAVAALPAVRPGAADEAVEAVWQACLRPGAPLLVVGSSMTVRRLDRLAAPAGREEALGGDPGSDPDSDLDGTRSTPGGAPGASAAPRAVANRGLAGIDGTVATAVGLAVGSRAPVRSVMGDLTFLHDAMSLVHGTAETEPDLQVVVIDDSGGSILRGLEYADVIDSQRLERLLAAPQAVDVAQLAQAAGARTLLPSSAAELRDLLDQPVQGLSVIVIREASVRQGSSVSSWADG